MKSDLYVQVNDSQKAGIQVQQLIRKTRRVLLLLQGELNANLGAYAPVYLLHR